MYYYIITLLCIIVLQQEDYIIIWLHDHVLLDCNKKTIWSYYYIIMYY